MLVLLAFAIAALLTYVLVLGLLTALAIPRHEDEDEDEAVSDPVSRGERVSG